MTKSNPNIFMSQPPQHPPTANKPQHQPQPQQQHQFIPPIHLLNPPVYHQRIPTYGKINLLRYGYSSNPKPRSDSRLFEQDSVEKSQSPQQQPQKQYHPQQPPPQQQAQPQPNKHYQHHHQHFLYQQHQLFQQQQQHIEMMNKAMKIKKKTISRSN